MKPEITVFENPKNVKRLLYGLYVALVVLLAADHFIHHHGHFAAEEAPYFFAAYGFTACVAVIFVSKVLRRWLGRKEGYYDE